MFIQSLLAILLARTRGSAGWPKRSVEASCRPAEDYFVEKLQLLPAYKIVHLRARVDALLTIRSYVQARWYYLLSLVASSFHTQRRSATPCVRPSLALGMLLQ